jgi:hypothetical protein
VWRWFRHYVLGIVLCLVGSGMVLIRQPLRMGEHRFPADNINMVGAAVIFGGVAALRFGVNRRRRDSFR